MYRILIFVPSLSQRMPLSKTRANPEGARPNPSDCLNLRSLLVFRAAIRFVNGTAQPIACNSNMDRLVQHRVLH
jgi:hypothetical protein